MDWSKVKHNAILAARKAASWEAKAREMPKILAVLASRPKK